MVDTSCLQHGPSVCAQGCWNFSFIISCHWRGQSTLFLCSSFYAKVIILLKLRITLAVGVIYVHQINKLGVLGGSMCAEALRGEMSSPYVLRSALHVNQCSLYLMFLSQHSMLWGETYLYGGRGHQVCETFRWEPNFQEQEKAQHMEGTH